MANYLYGGVGRLAWLTLRCIHDFDLFCIKVREEIEELIDYVESTETEDLVDSTIDKITTSYSNPKHKLGLGIFYDMHKAYYEHLLGSYYLGRIPYQVFALEVDMPNGRIVVEFEL